MFIDKVLRELVCDWSSLGDDHKMDEHHSKPIFSLCSSQEISLIYKPFKKIKVEWMSDGLLFPLTRGYGSRHDGSYNRGLTELLFDVNGFWVCPSVLNRWLPIKINWELAVKFKTKLGRRYYRVNQPKHGRRKIAVFKDKLVLELRHIPKEKKTKKPLIGRLCEYGFWDLRSEITSHNPPCCFLHKRKWKWRRFPKVMYSILRFPKGPFYSFIFLFCSIFSNKIKLFQQKQKRLL